MKPTLFPRRVIAVMIVLYFGDLTLRANVYTSGTFDTAKAIMPLAWWGAVICATGIAMLATTGRRAVTAAAIALSAWCGALAAAVAQGKSQAPMSTVWLIGTVVLLIWSTGRPGYTK